ncbi:hypothetical protein RUND412_004480 [Rhizina undulata]
MTCSQAEFSNPRASGRPPLPHAATAPAISHQSGMIKQHWNDLPENFISAPPSRTATPSMKASPAAESSEEEIECEFPKLLEILFSPDTPSSLSQREAAVLKDRVLKNMASITGEQGRELAEVIKSVVVDRTQAPSWGRERVVEFITRERGVAGWAMGVRKGLECVKF